MYPFMEIDLVRRIMNCAAISVTAKIFTVLIAIAVIMLEILFIELFFSEYSTRFSSTLESS